VKKSCGWEIVNLITEQTNIAVIVLTYKSGLLWCSFVPRWLQYAHCKLAQSLLQLWQTLMTIQCSMSVLAQGRREH